MVYMVFAAWDLFWTNSELIPWKMGTRWALSWFVCSCKVTVKFGLSSLCHLSEGEWSNEWEPILFDEVLSKGNVNTGIAKFNYSMRFVHIVCSHSYCGYYLWVSGKFYNCFRSWLDSTFDNYTFMSCHSVIFNLWKILLDTLAM